MELSGLLVPFDCSQRLPEAGKPGPGAACNLHPIRCIKIRYIEEITMAQSPPQVFSGITPEQYARLIQKAQAAGIDIKGSSGTASKFGVEVSWNYSTETRELAFQCLHSPFFMKPEEVHAKIQALVKESLA
jgi:hypothetical protein